MRLTCAWIFFVAIACNPDDPPADSTGSAGSTTDADTPTTSTPTTTDPGSTADTVEPTATDATTDDTTGAPPAAPCDPWEDHVVGPVAGQDGAADVVRDVDGSVYVAGWLDSSMALNDDDIWLRKYDAAGQELWTRTFDGVTLAHNERSDALALAPNGDVVLVGNDQSAPTPAGRDVRILRVSAAGDPIVDVVHAGAAGLADRAMDVLVTADDRIVLAGSITTATDVDAWIGVFSGGDGALVQEQFVKHLDGTREFLYAIAPLSDGGFIAVGVAESMPETQTQAWLVRLDSGLTPMWAVFPTPDGEDSNARGVVVTGDDHFIVAGSRATPDNKSDGWLARFDADGAEVWSHLTDGGGESIDFFTAIAIDGAGEVLTGGLERRNPMDSTVLTPYLRKFDGAGAQLWELSGEDLTNDHRIAAVSTTADGCVAVTGAREVVQNDSYETWTRVLAP